MFRLCRRVLGEFAAKIGCQRGEAAFDRGCLPGIRTGAIVLSGIWMLGIGIFGTGLPGIGMFGQVMACYAADGSSEPLPVCNDNEYILLAAGSNYAEIYDGEGNCAGRCRAYLDESGSAVTVKKDSLLEYTSGEAIRVFSMAELKNILEFSSLDYSLEICGSVCLATNRYTGQYRLYDCHGGLLYSSKEGTWIDAGYQGRILDLERGYLIGICRFEDDWIVPAIAPVWVSKDGQQTRELTDDFLIEAFGNWSMQEFGENVLVYDNQEETGAVYDLDGTILLDQVKAYLSPYTDDEWFYSYHQHISTALALQLTDGMYTVYDTELRETAMFSGSEFERPYLGYAGGFLQGVAYQQLEGNVCAGFVLYEDRGWCPYAETEDGCLVYADGKKILIPLKPGQNVSSLNEVHALASSCEDDMYIDSLIDCRTGETLLDSRWEEENSVYFELGRDFCIITETTLLGGDFQTSFKILDENNRVCCSSPNGSARPWKHGYIVLQRGIYNGIADRNGNWIVRTVYEEQE